MKIQGGKKSHRAWVLVGSKALIRNFRFSRCLKSKMDIVWKLRHRTQSVSALICNEAPGLRWVIGFIPELASNLSNYDVVDFTFWLNFICSVQQQLCLVGYRLTSCAAFQFCMTSINISKNVVTSLPWKFMTNFLLSWSSMHKKSVAQFFQKCQIIHPVVGFRKSN